MKISELASELINIYGDVELVEMLRIDASNISEPYIFKNVAASTMREDGHIHSTELLTYRGNSGKKHFVTANMSGYIDGTIEKALLLDFGRYIEEEEAYNSGD